jgi:hypothetical protein
LKKILLFGSLLVFTLAVVGCGGDDGAAEVPESSSAGSTRVTLSEGYADALPISSQLAIGTLMLEDSENAVTVEQAGELLPSWKMLQALQSSGTAAQAELDAVLNQIQGDMTDKQLAAIKEMKLTAASMLELAQERGFFRGGDGDVAGGGDFRPPAGVFLGGEGGPGGGRGLGGGFGPGGFVGGENLSEEERQAALSERMNTMAGTAMAGMLVSMLEARAGGETWEIAAPNQDFVLQRQIFGAVSEAAGLDQGEIVAQAREGKTLLEIAEASSIDVDEIVSQVVAAETERVDQAVADGSMEQADANDWLADLDARIKELLEQPLQFGGPGARGDTSQQP